MPYVDSKTILEAKKVDLLTYLQACNPHELVKLSGNVYSTKEHDSLKISNGKWMWWSRGIGGRSALDYLIKVKGYTFIDAVNVILNRFSGSSIEQPAYQKSNKNNTKAELVLPKKSLTSRIITDYLLNRGIDKEIIDYCIRNNLIYESLPYHNVVFVGYDNKNIARYAMYRAANVTRIMGDCEGSDKRFSFRLVSDIRNNEVHIFESAIDLLSYATLINMSGGNYTELNLLSLSGVYSPKDKIEESKIPMALSSYTERNPHITRIVTHFDNDNAGRLAAKTLKILLAERFEVVDDPPEQGKDFNDFLCIRKDILNEKNNRRIDMELL